MKLSDINYILNRIKLVKKVAKLNIDNAGIDSDGMPFVKLKNGPVFYGLKSKNKEKKYYNLLPNKFRTALPFECFMVANDIVIRYIEGGLMLGGPVKEMFYKVKPGDQIAEMGAYMGYYTLYLSEKVGENGRIIAIEPMPDNLKYLKKNIEANNIKNVSIVPKGVWKETSEMTFARKKGDHQSGSVELSYSENDSFSIPVDSLDNILSENNIDIINFMLIQLNGVEPEALEGLHKFKPTNFAFAARYSKDKNETAAEKIQRTLNSRGYECQIIENDFVFANIKE